MNQPVVKKPSVIMGILGHIWKIVDFARRFFSAIFVLLIAFFIIIGLIAEEPPLVVKSGSALLVRPNGIIVTQLTHVDPVAEALNTATEEPTETLLRDITDSIQHAKDDDRIKAIVLDTSNLLGGSTAVLSTFKAALLDFKQSGKKIYAYGDWYSQSQYYLASQADEVYLNPEGAVGLMGFDRTGMYFKKALEKFNIDMHIFRVGTFKSAVEPFLRDNMSDEAKEANRAWLGDLWQNFKQDIAAARQITADDVQAYIDNSIMLLQQTNGDSAQVALNNNLVDGLKTRIEATEYFIEQFGEGKKDNTYQAVHFAKYVKQARNDVVAFEGDEIAVITARGVIENGARKAGTIGDISLSKLIRKAREDENVKAVVLQVDSPGGSASASEFIRQELLKTKAEKPVIVSMAGLAASGGYWISANATEIWAQPNTITGSIGIYGMLPNFSKAAEEFLGITTDGVGTTKFAGAGNPLTPYNPELGELIQLSINNGYQKFLTIVAEGRGMSKEQVDQIAQGRVWSGAKAHELGLVDQLGGLQDAIAAAAEKAGVTDYKVTYVKQEEKPLDKMVRQILNTKVTLALVDMFASDATPFEQQTQLLAKQIKSFASFSDPKHAYAHCFCDAQF